MKQLNFVMGIKQDKNKLQIIVNLCDVLSDKEGIADVLLGTSRIKWLFSDLNSKDALHASCFSATHYIPNTEMQMTENKNVY